jgi:ferritin-like metal-binding protein YciE
MEILEGSVIHSKLDDFFVSMLSEIYWSEINLLNVLSSMETASTLQELKEAFSTHKEQTQVHVERLEEVFSMLGVPAEAIPSIGLQGIFDEGWQVIDESEAGSAQRDVALIIAAQKVEHYEMACYGSIITLARTLNRPDVAELLLPTLQEEKETDALLTIIAESKRNEDASEEPSDL